MSADQDDRPRRNPLYAFRPIADEGCLVVNPERAVVEVLNPVATTIYSLLDGAHTEDQIVRAVMDEFEVSEAEAKADVRRFVEELAERGMLARADATAGQGSPLAEADDDE